MPPGTWAEPLPGHAAPEVEIPDGTEQPEEPAADEVEEAERADTTADARWLQCRVNDVPPADASPAVTSPAAASQPGPPNTFAEGANVVTVFVGALERGALAAGALTPQELGFTRPHLSSVRLTAVLVPLEPHGRPSRADLRVPRHGRSSDAHLELDLPPGTRDVSARLLLVHRNRVLQTAVLSGVVGGPAALTEYTLVHPTLTDLRRRRPFDATVVANHTAAGRPGLMAHRDGATTNVDVPVMRELEPVVSHLSDVLVRAADLRPRAGDRPGEAEVALLVELALWGRDLHGFLKRYLLPFGERLERLQLVTARSAAFLPLELAYTRYAPRTGAALCPSWLAGGEGCGPSCGDGPTDRSIVCPAAFLGMHATIERQYLDDLGPGGERQVLTTATPTRRRRRLTVTRAALGASRKVTAADVAATLDALGAEAHRASTWAEWEATLAAADTDLLVLMPHTDETALTMEISSTTLRRGELEVTHVTGARDVRPVVLLLGCDTTGSVVNPGGFATRFLENDAAVVVSSLAKVRGAHAARLAQRLVTDLRAAAADRRRTPLGDLVTAWRRAAVAEGWPVALALTAYGDADWTI